VIQLSQLEGIIPALESAHAIAYILREAGREIPRGSRILVNLSGRGDKDVAQIRDVLANRS
jgi:tryptophan synthase beta chain